MGILYITETDCDYKYATENDLNITVSPTRATRPTNYKYCKSAK